MTEHLSLELDPLITICRLRLIPLSRTVVVKLQWASQSPRGLAKTVGSQHQELPKCNLKPAPVQGRQEETEEGGRPLQVGG